MFSKIKKLHNLPRILLKLPSPFVNASILGKDYNVREGTIRAKADYDDGWLLACSFSAKRIFDIGSNIGQASFYELYPDNVEHVLLVDPNPQALSIAAENLIHNRLIERVNFSCAFVSDKPCEEVDFYTVGSGAAGSMYSSHAKTAAKKHLHNLVPTTTLDELCKRFGIPDLLKIDVEGAESKVLAGGSQLLGARKTRVLVEVHSSSELPMVQNAVNILSICSTLEYKAWYLSRKTELKAAKQLKDRGRCHLLLQPAEWEWPGWVQIIPQGAGISQELFSQVSTMVNETKNNELVID